MGVQRLGLAGGGIEAILHFAIDEPLVGQRPHDRLLSLSP